MTLVAKLVMVGILVFSGGAKLQGDVGPGALLPEGMAVVLGALELVAALLIAAGRWARALVLAVLALAVGGAFLALIYPDTPCGCYGAVVLSPPIRLALSATLGMSAILMLDALGGSACARVEEE